MIEIVPPSRSAIARQALIFNQPARERESFGVSACQPRAESESAGFVSRAMVQIEAAEALAEFGESCAGFDAFLRYRNLLSDQANFGIRASTAAPYTTSFVRVSASFGFTYHLPSMRQGTPLSRKISSYSVRMNGSSIQ